MIKPVASAIGYRSPETANRFTYLPGGYTAMAVGHTNMHRRTYSTTRETATAGKDASLWHSWVNNPSPEWEHK